jgi:hypothetical protein
LKALIVVAIAIFVVAIVVLRAGDYLVVNHPE